MPGHTLCPLPPACPAAHCKATTGAATLLAQAPAWPRARTGQDTGLSTQGLCQSGMSQCHPPIAPPLPHSRPVSPLVQSQYRLTLSHYGGGVVPVCLSAVPVEPSVTFPTALALFQYSPV